MQLDINQLVTKHRAMGVAVPVGLWLFAWVWLAAVYVVSGAEVRAGGVKAARAAVEREHIIDLTGAWQVFNPNHSECVINIQLVCNL